jgi:hypothetical protein
MKKNFLTFAILAASSGALAKKNCTDQPKDKWMTEESFRKLIESKGYKISKFKQPGTCYEIYGMNKDGKKVEVYCNPVDGSVVKEQIE